MDDVKLQFAQPWWLAFGALLLVGSVLLFLRADARRRGDLTKLAHPRFHERLVAGWSPTLRWVRRGFWMVAVFSLTVAAARPQYGHEWREVKRRGIDILFALDCSQSMLAEDLTPNRLERARLGILDFLGRLEGDRVGLIPFAGTAFALCPLTLDYSAFRESLNSVSTDLIPRQGTDLASAIEEAGRLFDEEGNNQRFLVLITDGEDLEGEALAAAKREAENGTTIYTVGVGAEDGQLIPIRGHRGRVINLRDADGELVKTSLDAATLEKIAQETGGLYVPLGRGAEGLDAIYERRLAMVPKSELSQKLEKVPLERFQWPLGLAVLLLTVQLLMSERRREDKRRRLPSVARRVRPVMLLGLVFLLSGQRGRADAVKVYNSGTEAYALGEFEEAAESLTESLSTPDLELQGKAYYNLGSSLYRIGQGSLQEDPKKTIATWEKSLKAFEDSLELNPQDEDAEFNRAFVEKKLEELKQQENQDQNQENKGEDQEGEDQEGEDQEGQDQEGQDQEGQDQEGQDQEGQDQEGQDQEGQDQEGQDQEGQDQEGQDQEGQDQEGQGEEEESENMKGQEDRQDSSEEESGQDGEEPGEAQEETEASGEEQGEEPGESQPAGEGGEDGQGSDASEVVEGGEGRQEGEMSREEAIRLLETLSNDERIVIPAPLSDRNRERQKQRIGKEKTW